MFYFIIVLVITYLFINSFIDMYKDEKEYRKSIKH